MVLGGFLVFLGSVTPSRQYIPRECLFLPRTEPIRGRSCMVWPSSPLFIYGSTLGGSYDPRKTEEVHPPPSSPPHHHPRFINKHTGRIGGDAVRLNRVSEFQTRDWMNRNFGRANTTATLLHRGQIFDRLQPACVCVCFGCVLECVFFSERVNPGIFSQITLICAH